MTGSGGKRHSIRLQPSYVLHSRPYRDSSLLLEAMTAQEGRISLVARGVRKPSRKGTRAGLLQPFTPLLLSCVGAGDLRTLTAVEAAGAPFAIRGEAVYSGLYINELLTRLLPRYDSHPRLFAAYSDVLKALAEQAVADGSLRRFELKLLDELGYRLDLTATAGDGEAVVAGASYTFDPDEGLARTGERASDTVPVYRGEHLIAMAAGDFEGDMRLPARRLLRAALARHLGEVPLRSRELFRRHRPLRQASDTASDETAA